LYGNAHLCVLLLLTLCFVRRSCIRAMSAHVSAVYTTGPLVQSVFPKLLSSFHPSGRTLTIQGRNLGNASVGADMDVVLGMCVRVMRTLC